MSDNDETIPCPRCKGKGLIIDDEDGVLIDCPNCDGSGVKES